METIARKYRRYKENPTTNIHKVSGVVDGDTPGMGSEAFKLTLHGEPIEYLAALLGDDATLAAFKLLLIVARAFSEGKVHLDRSYSKIMKSSDKTYYRALDQLLDRKVLFRSENPEWFWINQGELKEELENGD